MSDLYFSSSDNSFTILNKEVELISNECKNLNNESLIDECYNLSLMYHHEEVIGIINKYHKTGLLSPLNRKRLDSFYILVHTELCWGEDGKIHHIR